MKKLYIGNLPFSATENELQTLFGELGEVTSAAIITDKMTGRSRGFGFVEMTNDEEADQAIEKFNGHEMDGRPLVVNEARPLEER